MADQRTYPCTDAQLASLAGLPASHGVTVDLTHPGRATEQGWDISWLFPTADTISISVLKHPFAEESFLWSRLDAIFGG